MLHYRFKRHHLLAGLVMAALILRVNFLMDIAAAVPMSHTTAQIVKYYVNAGMGAASIIALLGGGGLIVFIVRKAFQSGIKKIILAA